MTPSPISALPLKPAAQERSRTVESAGSLCGECSHSPFEQQMLEASSPGESLQGATEPPSIPASELESRQRRAEDAEGAEQASATGVAPADGQTAPIVDAPPVVAPLENGIPTEGDALRFGASPAASSGAGDSSISDSRVGESRVGESRVGESEDARGSETREGAAVAGSEIGAAETGSGPEKASATASTATATAATAASAASDRQGLEAPTPGRLGGDVVAPAEGSGGRRGAAPTPASAGVAQPAAAPRSDSPAPGEPPGRIPGLVGREGVDSPLLNPSAPPAPQGVAAGPAAGASHDLASRVELPRDTRLAADGGSADGLSDGLSADAAGGLASDTGLSSEGELSSDRESPSGSGGLRDMELAPQEGVDGEFSEAFAGRAPERGAYLSGELAAERPPTGAVDSPNEVDALPPGPADAKADAKADSLADMPADAKVETRGGLTPGAQAAAPPARPGLDGPAPPPRTAADQVAAALHRVRDSEGREETRMEIRLDPPELGRVEIVVRLVDDRLSARIVAADEQARQALERDLSELKASLERAGVALELDIGGRDRSSHRGAEPGPGGSRRLAEPAGAPSAEASPHRASATDGPGRRIDLIV